MGKSSKVVIRGRRSREDTKEDFPFTREIIRLPETSEYIRDYRMASWDKYQSMPYPDKKMESWRRTDIQDLHPERLNIPSKVRTDSEGLKGYLPSKLLSNTYGGLLYLGTHGIQDTTSNELVENGVIFVDLQTAEKEHPHILEKVMGKIVKAGENKFSSLAGALAQIGLLLYVPKGVRVEKPLYSNLWAAGANLAFFSHIMVVLEDDASVTFIQEYTSPEEENKKSVHAGLVELIVGEGAHLEYIELLSWGENIWDISTKACQVEKKGNVDWLIGNIGGKLIKNIHTLNLVGSEGSGKMKGFYITSGHQHIDFDTQQNHLAPHTTSDLLYKGVLLDQSRAVWQGMIHVSPDAHHTDGYQANRNLILSSDARADSIPGLEILVDDVRCSHSATVGSLDADQIFYFQSRGISKKLAEAMIVEGFLEPIMQTVKIDEIKKRYQEKLKNLIDIN